MEQGKLCYYIDDGTATEVHVLVFNGAINIYNAESDNFIKGYPLKGATFSENEDEMLVYPEPSKTGYLRISVKDRAADSILKAITNANHGTFKKLAQQRVLWFVAAIAGLIIGLYFLITTLVPYIGGALISRDTEIKLGNQLKDVMLAEEKVSGAVVDSTASIRLQAFAGRIKLSSTYPIRVTLLKSPVVNAYALPGGQIVVYTGMLKNISEPEELAALLAHEASHVNQRHSLKAMLRSTADALIISILFGDVSAITATIIGNSQSLRGLDYSRSAEREADENGMQLMLENNIDVAGMRKLMQILEKQGDVPDNISFLSSHPLTRSRIEAADEFIREHPQKVNADSSLQLLFRQLKQ